MLIVVMLALVGLLAGGMAGGALADATAGHRGDIGALFIGLVVGAAIGAAGGGAIGWGLRQKFSGDSRQSNVLTGGFAFAFVVLALGYVGYEKVSENARNPGMVRADGGGLSLIYEMRLPPGAPMPARSDLLIELRTPEETMKAVSARLRQEGGRVMIQGNFWVTKAVASRVVAFRNGNGPTHLFTMKLAPRPADRGGRWSAWQSPDGAHAGASGQSQPEEVIEIRYAANY